MNVQSDFPLIVFTILAQTAVGAFLVLGVGHWLATRKSGTEAADKMSDRLLLVIGPLLVLGMIASFFHLGDPLNAPRAVTQVGQSWLSREILFAVLFAASGLAFTVMQWRKIGTTVVRNIVALVAGIFGVVLVFSMAMVYYNLPTVPAWNSEVTLASFFTTTLLLGTLATGAALVGNYTYLKSREPSSATPQLVLLQSSLRGIGLAAIVLAGIQFIIIPIYLAQLASEGTRAATESLNLLVSTNGWAFAIRLVLLFFGAIGSGIIVYRYAASSERFTLVSTLTYVAFATVLIAELLGRYLFYASYARIGM